MTARYLIRLDDACPTMRHSAWAEIEAMLDRNGIKPIVGVIPENQDPDLMIDPASSGFWDRVRSWQNKGWTIGMHGCHHVFHSVPRSRLLLPFYDKSEFAGLPLSAQAALIARSWAVFSREGVRPSVWIAPAHCFDADTLRGIEQETPIRIVSDGLSLDQYYDRGFHWLPQQLWAPQPRTYGLWTICLHPSNMIASAIRALDEQLSMPYFRDRLVSVGQLRLSTRKKGLQDDLFERYFWAKGRAHQALARVRRTVGLAR